MRTAMRTAKRVVTLSNSAEQYRFRKGADAGRIGMLVCLKNWSHRNIKGESYREERKYIRKKET